MIPCPAPIRHALALGCLAGVLGGCRDAPTLPLALQQAAGGEQWAAMAVPEQLPSLSTWLPYVEQDTPEGRRVTALIRELEREAELARRDGLLSRAAELEREATRVAVLALERNPEPHLLQQSLFALDLWSDRVRAQVRLDSAPALLLSLRAVEAARTGAAGALTAGDTTTAVLQIAGAAERVREHSPSAVALRALTQAEERLEALPARGSAVKRALRLVRSAREELLGGNPSRALQRALYALQLTEGRELRIEPGPPAEPCSPPACEG